MSAACNIQWLGRVEYREAWRLQLEIAVQVLSGELPDTLLLLEHPPTITLGRGADRANILADSALLSEQNIEVIESDRGGDVTYHGPGQLVAYPILNLRRDPHLPDLHIYLRKLEETLILAMLEYGISADRFPGFTGVWTGMNTGSPRKIAAIGVKVRQWITQHGFALNVSPDLAHFDHIIPCGIREYGVTSLSKLLNRDITIEETLPHLISSFCSVFRIEPAKENPLHNFVDCDII